MSKVLLIKVFDGGDYAKGQTFLSNKYFLEMQKMFPEISNLGVEKIEDAIGIYARKDNYQLPAKKLKITALRVVNNSVNLNFTVEADLKQSAEKILKSTANLLKKSGQWDGNGFLPLWCLLTAEQAAAVLKPGFDLAEFEQRNDWLSIYKKFDPIADLRQKFPEVWQDDETLSTIGFACGKLAETSGFPKEIWKDEQKKKDFLHQQARYRKETEMLRKRCIELSPKNASYLSNLAYFHYQNVHELTQPRGRRDGNLRQEIDQALDYVDQTLAIDPNRLNDLYRKGYLLVDILPKQILFGPPTGEEDERPALANKTRMQGIETLQRVVNIWEGLPEDHYDKKRRRKEYIKALYHLGQSYCELIRNVWDEAIYVLSLKDGVSTKPGHIPADWTNANKAWEYLHKCWQLDGTAGNVPAETALNKTSPVGAVEGVFRLYWLGKVAFVQYWITSGYGQQDIPESIPYRDKAEKFLQAALELSWSPEAQNQRKDFIAELLARLYISQGQYDKAVGVIERHTGQKRDAYIEHTLALALIKQEKYSRAQQILQSALENRSNKDLWTAHLLKGCSYMEEGKLDQARSEFEEAKKLGKSNVDSLLIGLAFISYKSQDRPKAIEYLQEAQAINRYRLAIQTRLESWKNQEESSKRGA